MALDTVNERSTHIVRVEFFDENDDPVTPSTATYRIDDERSKTVILPKTSISGLDVSVDLEITQDQNRNLNDQICLETRIVTVEFTYGSGRKGTAEYKYVVKNLYGVQSSSPSASFSPSASISPS